ncbi:MAG TPA: hypothetical protein VF476_08690 [Chitinophagaceae bacterium]
MNYYKIFLTMACCLFSLSLLHAQPSEQASADSMQRIIMKDSLGVSDSIITKVFNLRNNYLLSSAQIDANTIFTQQEKNEAKRLLIQETNTAVKNALGEVAYEHYTEMIRRRMRERPGQHNTKPLASGGNN